MNFFLGGKRSEYEIYGAFNVIVKRNRSENNFKSVLETIRDLMIQCDGDVGDSGVVPDFIHDILLGYGSPGSAHYSCTETSEDNGGLKVDFRDTFLNVQHLQESFPNMVIKFVLLTFRALNSISKISQKHYLDTNLHFQKDIFPLHLIKKVKAAVRSVNLVILKRRKIKSLKSEHIL